MNYLRTDNIKKLLKIAVIKILQFEAYLVLRKYKPKIVAITGTVGKTSTKDAIFCVLKDVYYVRKSEKSYNSQIGVPLTILGLPNAWNSPIGWIRNICEGLLVIILPNHYPKWLILEMGVDRPGDMKKLSRWVKPDYVVLTRFSKVPVHVEHFAEVEDVWREKLYILRSLKEDGTVLYNGDDEEIKDALSKWNLKNFSYGFGEGLALTASNYAVVYVKKGTRNAPAGITFKVEHASVSLPAVVSGALGFQHVYPALAALSLGILNNINLVDMAESLSFHQTPLGRMKILSGLNGSVLIDDTYNSSPIALEEALYTMKNIKWTGRKILVLGDMLELGNFSKEEHNKAGRLAAKVGSLLITVGLRAEGIREGALQEEFPEEKTIKCNTSDEAATVLEKEITSKDLVLIKGSQGMRMEKVTERILKNREDAEFLLVRQEKEWKEK